MYDNDFMAAEFEAHRAHLGAVAYRMLGSLAEAEDAVQESWFRLARADARGVVNLGGWLTTIVARVCLNMLQSRRSRREDPLDTHVPDPIVSIADGTNPEHEALLADSVGLALLVVLQTLAPAERLAFVLHDLFAVRFDDIALIVERSPTAARQLASRARRRLQAADRVPDTDLVGQRRVVEAFLAASRGGEFDALLAVLDPHVVLRADGGALLANASKVIRGAAAVAEQALTFTRLSQFARLAVVNGTAGVVTTVDGQLLAVMGFTIRGARIIEIDILADPERLAQFNLAGWKPLERAE